MESEYWQRVPRRGFQFGVRRWAWAAAATDTAAITERLVRVTSRLYAGEAPDGKRARFKRIRGPPIRLDVISLKKLIDSNQDELFRCTLHAYRAALEAIGNSGVQACPPAGSQLQLGLRNLQRQLADETTPRQVSVWKRNCGNGETGRRNIIRARPKNSRKS